MVSELQSASRKNGPELAELLREVRRIEIQSRRLASGPMAGNYESAFRGSGIEFEELREYAEGDDPRSVDWNVTARMGRLFVRKYRDERDRTVVFLLDLSASMEGGFGIWSLRQTAARLCACLAFAAVRSQDRVGLVAFCQGAGHHFVPPRKGTAHALRIVRDAMALPSAEGASDLAPALEFVSRVVRRRAIVFVISDFFSVGWQRALSLCARRHETIAVRLLAPEVEAPSSELLRLRDPESHLVEVVDWTSARVRAAYRDRIACWRASTEKDLRKARVDLLDVPVPRKFEANAIARPVLEFFRMRERREAKR